MRHRAPTHARRGRASRWALAAPLAALLAAPAAARPQDPAPPPARLDPSQVPAVVERDGLLGLFGARYKAVLDAEAVAFVPALGRAAPRAMPLRLALEDVRVGSTALAIDRAAPPVRAGELRAEYRRSDAVVERYDARPEGVEQSFVFEALPRDAAGGELVVRLRVETELGGPVPDGDGLAFLAAGLGGVRVGGVLGIDAAGRTAPGELRYAAPWLELALPADFVADAALPLVLDPLIGPVIDVANSPLNFEAAPDVAYCDDGVYLIAYTTVFGGDDAEIGLARVDSEGGLVGDKVLPTFPAENPNDNPSVAATYDGFLVAWETDYTIPFWAYTEIRGVYLAADGSHVSPVSTLVDSTLGSASQPDLAGREVGSSYGVLVWTRLCGGVWACGVEAQAGGPVLTGAEVALSPSDCNNSAPSIAKVFHEGPLGETLALVAWRRTAPAEPSDLRMALLDWSVNVRASDQPLATTATSDELLVDVDGDGTTWVAAFLRESSDGTHRIKRRHVTWDGTSLSTPVEGNVYSSSEELWDVSIAYGGGAWFVGFVEGSESVVDQRAKLRTLVDGTYTACGPTTTIATLANSIAVATVTGTTDPSPHDAAFVAWGDGNVAGAHVTEAVSQVQDLGGGCGAGGVAETPCTLGPGGHAVSLSSAAPSAPALLLLSYYELGAPCGSCTLVPDPFGGVVVAGQTGASGALELPLGVALLPGQTFLAQWAVLPPGAAACPELGVDLSNAIRVTIQ